MARPRSPKDRARPLRKRRSAPRIAATVAALGAVAVIGLWVAVNRVTWLGPYVADSLRAVIGVDAVASLEDFAYRVQDRVNRVWRRGEKPRAYWSVPKAKTEPITAPAQAAPAVEPEPREEIPPFALKDVGPVHKEWSAPGDGQWVSMVDSDHPGQPIHMAKTLLHPDKNRSWAEVFVVAVDLRRARLYLVPGTKEPAATEEAAQGLERPGSIGKEHREHALAAFNGGFKTEHGQYGMGLDGTTYVKPKLGVCAIARYKDDSVRLAL